MKNLLFLLMFLNCLYLQAQNSIPGRVIDKQTREPLPYASISTSSQEVLSNIDGSFKITLNKQTDSLRISYVGYETISTSIDQSTRYLQVGMKAKTEKLSTVFLSTTNPSAEKLIKKAIAGRERNDPEKALNAYQYSSYSKFVIDDENGILEMEADSTAATMEIIIEEGRAYLSEKVSTHFFNQKSGPKEQVEGIRTAGFKKPVYNLLAMDINPFSLYKRDYKLFKTDYAGPLAPGAFKNYEYRILDTIIKERPTYMIYFKPKREKVVAGLEGILYLDTLSLAIQKAKAQLLGQIKLEVEHDFEYFPEMDLWFPRSQTTTIQAGSGGKEIAVFGGNISLGAVQQKRGALDLILSSKPLDKNLVLKSKTKHFDIKLEPGMSRLSQKAEIMVVPGASFRSSEYWKENRRLNFSLRDLATQEKVDSIIQKQEIEKKIDFRKAIASGYYPVDFWDIDISKIFKFNNYEGIRLGFGGRTNQKFSEAFNLNGYTTYGFKDETLKYGLGTEIYLYKPTETNLKFYYSRDIRETAAFNYLKGENTFSILEPRFVNINFFHNYRTYWIGLEHHISPSFQSEIRFGFENIWQTRDYTFIQNNMEFTDYNLALAKFSFRWQPFSRFLRTPEGTVQVEKNFPQFTGQVEQAVEVFEGDFNFTRIGLKLEHEIKRLDLSRTEFILEGNYGIGDLPLSHAFHSNPNNPSRDRIFRRFSVAGRNSFETMYFNEFYSERQASLHIRHQLRPFLITENFKPELVFISRFAIGDFENQSKHKHINFNTLEKGYSEAGLELNKILAGFGLSAAYRYGAYHLPSFKQNFSFKFTLQVQL